MRGGMWKTGGMLCWLRVVGGFTSARQQCKSGKHFPFADSFTLTIYSPPLVPDRNPSRRTRRPVSTKFPHGPKRPTLNHVHTSVRWQSFPQLVTRASPVALAISVGIRTGREAVRGSCSLDVQAHVRGRGSRWPPLWASSPFFLFWS